MGGKELVTNWKGGRDTKGWMRRSIRCRLSQISESAADRDNYALLHRVSEKNEQNYFCYNYVKLPPKSDNFWHLA